jgi:hypothetical protein
VAAKQSRWCASGLRLRGGAAPAPALARELLASGLSGRVLRRFAAGCRGAAAIATALGIGRAEHLGVVLMTPGVEYFVSFVLQWAIESAGRLNCSPMRDSVATLIHFLLLGSRPNYLILCAMGS